MEGGSVGDLAGNLGVESRRRGTDEMLVEIWDVGGFRWLPGLWGLGLLQVQAGAWGG